MEILKKIEQALKSIITAGDRANFFCDSHENLCKYCIGFRHILRAGKLPDFMLIYTNHGKYVYHDEALHVTHLSRKAAIQLDALFGGV